MTEVTNGLEAELQKDEVNAADKRVHDAERLRLDLQRRAKEVCHRLGYATLIGCTFFASGATASAGWMRLDEYFSGRANHLQMWLGTFALGIGTGCTLYAGCFVRAALNDAYTATRMMLGRHKDGK